jgi:hypothetical protein
MAVGAVTILYRSESGAGIFRRAAALPSYRRARHSLVHGTDGDLGSHRTRATAPGNRVLAHYPLRD